ncbi:MAG: hypothetical protein LBU39_10950 [Desulfobulbaceae bacterium]|jgi:hypothetical protein|nr:hypothetical protein [Desulfobulbaceae bacterium]
MRTIMILLIFSLFIAEGVGAMTAAPTKREEARTAQSPSSSWQVEKHDEKIYFLSFDGVYLRTTAGTAHAATVKIVNHGTEDIRALDGATRKIVVEFTVVDRVITQADIYP